MYTRPEEQLLLECARTKLSEDNQDKIRRLVSNSLNWDYLLQMSKSHSLIPLLYYHLHRIDLDHQIPTYIMDELHDIYYSNLARNLLLYDELSQVLKSFEEKRILVVVKGLALAEQVYKNVALRPMADVDLLVQKRNLPEVMKTLFKLGFEILSQEKQVTIKYMNELHLVKRQENVKYLPSLIINVHWDLTAPVRFEGTTKIDTQQMMSRTQPAKIACRDILVMRPEDQILWVIYHATFQHPFIGLLQLCDVAELIKLEENRLDWHSLVKTSKKGRIATATYYLLSSAKKLLGAPVPDCVLKALTPNLLKRSILNILLVKSSFLTKCPTHSIASRYLLQLLMLDKIVDTLFLFWKAVFPPSEWLAAYYDRPASKKLYSSHLINLLTIGLAGIRDTLKSSGKK
ncbi:MAG: nucleotidyltransferase family protein [bacterium]